METLVECPDSGCGAVAEIVEVVAMASTDGPVELVRTRCLRRHIYDLPAERLTVLETVDHRPDGRATTTAARIDPGTP
jgi:hypothetical protein